MRFRLIESTIDRWREILLTLSRRRLRTVLTALSVAWGIFMLVVLLAAGKGLSNGADNAFRDDAMNSVWIQGGNTRKAYQGQSKGRRIRLTNEDFALVSQVATIADHKSARFFPRADALTSFRGNQANFQIRGVHPDYQYLEKTTMETGRFLNAIDITERRKVAVLGRNVVNRLFRDGTEPLGADINIGKNKFRVVGTFADAGEQREQETVYVPISTAQLVFGGAQKVDGILFSVGSSTVEETNATVKNLTRRLAEKYGFALNDLGALRVMNRHEFSQKLNGVFFAINAFVWLIGLGTILAGVVGVGNIMMIAVKERTREFGVRKALGARPASIVMMVLEEALVVTTASGYLGLVAAVAVVEFAKTLLPETDFFRNPDVNLTVGLLATGVLVLAGLLAGFMPARRAAAINPIEALRSEG